MGGKVEITEVWFYNSAWNVKAKDGGKKQKDLGKETGEELGSRKEKFHNSASARESRV